MTQAVSTTTFRHNTTSVAGFSVVANQQENTISCMSSTWQYRDEAGQGDGHLKRDFTFAGMKQL